MAIEFHCEHCGRMVRTGDEHAGKRGKCPHCHQSVYIPTPSSEIEILKLSPIDSREEQEKRRQDEEAREVARRIRADRDAVPEPSKASLPDPVGDIRLRPDMQTLVVEYVLAMANGKLGEAEEYAADIRADRKAAAEVIQRLTMDEVLPLKLSKIPRPVLVGFLKQLREPG